MTDRSTSPLLAGLCSCTVVLICVNMRVADRVRMLIDANSWKAPTGTFDPDQAQQHAGIHLRLLCRMNCIAIHACHALKLAVDEVARIKG